MSGMPLPALAFPLCPLLLLHPRNYCLEELYGWSPFTREELLQQVMSEFNLVGFDTKQTRPVNRLGEEQIQICLISSFFQEHGEDVFAFVEGYRPNLPDMHLKRHIAQQKI